MGAQHRQDQARALAGGAPVKSFVRLRESRRNLKESSSASNAVATMPQIMRPQCANGCLGSLDEDTCSRAAKAGHLDCLKYAHEHGCPWDEDTCIRAAKGGHLDCLKYAHEHGCPWDEDTCSRAAKGGHLDCLKYAYEHDCPWAESEDETCWKAALGGHLDCLKYAHEQGFPWDDWTCSRAAKGGHLDCLKYAHEQGCPWDYWTCIYAAAGGHLDCLKYAHEHGCPWNGWTCSDAAEGGHLECLKYAHEHGCNLDKETSSFIGSVQHDRELYIAVIIYAKMPKSNATAKAIIDKVLLIRRMKEAYRHAAATRIQRMWKERMYRPGGVGMLGAGRRFHLMSQHA